MSKELTKKAVELLLGGATLVSDPCPYCKGVRVMKNGNALCISCGREAKEDQTGSPGQQTEKPAASSVDNLDQKIRDLTSDLQKEKDFEKQKQIIHTLNEVIALKEKLAGR